MNAEHYAVQDPSNVPLLASKRLPNLPAQPLEWKKPFTAASDSRDTNASVVANNGLHHPELSESDLRSLRHVYNRDIKILPYPRRSAYDFINEWWLWEFLGWFISLIAMVALVMILNKYNGRALPEWPRNISLNSVMSLFTTVFKSTLLIPVVEGISQLKWCLFHRSQVLQEMERYDIASRGPYGSLWFLFSSRIGYVFYSSCGFNIV